jgi:hypothetical protein
MIRIVVIIMILISFLILPGCTSAGCNKETEYCPVKQGRKISSKEWVSFSCPMGGKFSIRAGDMKASSDVYCYCMKRKYKAVCKGL